MVKKTCNKLDVKFLIFSHYKIPSNHQVNTKSLVLPASFPLYLSNKLSYIWDPFDYRVSKDLDVISGMAYQGSQEKKPTEIFKENIALGQEIS